MNKPILKIHDKDYSYKLKISDNLSIKLSTLKLLYGNSYLTEIYLFDINSPHYINFVNREHVGESFLSTYIKKNV